MIVQTVFRAPAITGAFLYIGVASADETRPATLEEICQPQVAQGAAAIAPHNRFDALTALGEIARQCPDNYEAWFLLGMLHMQADELDEAISRFRHILERAPDTPRVRLELARAYYLKKDDEKARHHFRLALAGDIPPAVKANVSRFLDQIRRRQAWSVTVEASVAPDTNINSGTSDKTVEIFGLPFELSEDTRRNSGVGFNIGMNGRYFLPISDNVRWTLGAGASHSQYKGALFDQTQVNAVTGPRFILGRHQLDLRASYRRMHWLKDWYNESYGVELADRFDVNPRFQLTGTARVSFDSYDQMRAQNGRGYSLSISPLYALNAQTYVFGAIGGEKRTAKVRANGYDGLTASAGLYRELPFGFSLALRPSVAWSRYKGLVPIFWVKRKDRIIEGQASILNRRLEFLGFSPAITVSQSWRKSTVSLYSSTRTKVEIGVTREF